MGTALIDMEKIFEYTQSEKYLLSDYRVILWQPAWLDIKMQKESE